jgi:hypothetical protein
VNVDENAPAYAAREAQIAADPQLVWDVLTGFEDWPAWNPDVKSMSASGVAATGTTFRWKTGFATISSTVQQVEPPREIGWTGKTFGITAAHVWRLQPRGDGTFVRTEESFEGPLARLLSGTMRKTIGQALDSTLGHLASEAERRAQQPRSPEAPLA